MQNIKEIMEIMVEKYNLDEEVVDDILSNLFGEYHEGHHFRVETDENLVSKLFVDNVQVA